jgi:ATP-binding cassette, subfamily B, bacterial MsbA
MKAFRKIVELTKPYWPRIFVGILLGFMASGITGAIAWSIKPALDKIFMERRYEYLHYLPAGVFFLFVLKGFIGFGQSYMMRSAGMKLIRETRNRLFSHVIYLPLSYFQKESSGIIISRIMNDAQKMNQLVSGVLKEFVVEIPTVIILLGVAVYRNWQLTFVSLLLAPLIAFSARKFGKGLKKKTKRAQKNVSFLTHRINESIAGSRIVKVFNREDKMAMKFFGENQKFYREAIRGIRLRQSGLIVVDVVTGFGIALVLWFGGNMVKGGTMTLGEFGSIIVAIYMMFSPLKKIGEAYGDLQECMASVERVDSLFDAMKEEQGGEKVSGFQKSIRFDEAAFRYSEGSLPVLRGLNLEIQKGEVIAIVGRSGVGKSTLVDLIPRFIKPSEGKVTLDGKDINTLDVHSLRDLIAVVSQDVLLFNDTVRENIAFGKPGASEKEIIEAARMAHADEFINELPEKYNAVIGERGLKLSGGQRQRIAIARAVLKNPPLLILDEATSSLDSVSEAIVQKALEELMKDRTTIVIAHRLSTIINSDRIVVLDKGRIADIGTHSQLISSSNIYLELYNTFALAKKPIKESPAEVMKETEKISQA